MNYCLGIWIYQKARAVSKVPAPDAYFRNDGFDDDLGPGISDGPGRKEAGG
jgi:hypothetical protein